VTGIRVLIADDHQLARAAIRTILSRDPAFAVVGEAATAEAAVALTGALQPDLVLMDMRMPGGGPWATRQIKAAFPHVRVVVVTVSEAAEDLFEAIRAGAQGYLIKDLETGLWPDYLRSIMDAEAPISRPLARRILEEMAQPPLPASSVSEPLLGAPSGAHRDSVGSPAPAEPLTPREREVLEWVALGLTNREVARRLRISENTVKNHLKNLLAKLQAGNRTQLVRHAVVHGLVPGHGPFGSSRVHADRV